MSSGKDKHKFTLVRTAKTQEDQQFFKDQIYKKYKSLRECGRDLDLPCGKLEKFVQGKARMTAKDLNRLAKVCGFSRAEVTAHSKGEWIPRENEEKYQEPAPGIPDMSKPLTVETINDGGVMNLAAAIVGNAAKEYKLAVKKAKKRGIDRDEYECRFAEFVELKNIKSLREYISVEYNTAVTAFRRTAKTERLVRVYACGQLRGVLKAEESRISDQIAPITKIISGEEYFHSDDFRSLADINPDAVIEKVWRDVWKDKNLKISHTRGNA